MDFFDIYLTLCEVMSDIETRFKGMVDDTRPHYTHESKRGKVRISRDLAGKVTVTATPREDLDE